MHVYWLEQTGTDIAVANSWLSFREVAWCDGFRFPRRRADWRLGRWTAKRAVASYLGLPDHPQGLAAIEIRPAASGAPEVFIADDRAPVAISLSHRAARALCVVAPIDAGLGCDLEAIEPRSSAFVADYFTPEEQQIIACEPGREQQRRLALLWSAKESALKTLHEGLRLDTRTVIVSFELEARTGEAWAPFHVRYDERVFDGWWREGDNFVRTIIVDPSPDLPVHLESAPGFLNKTFRITGRNERFAAQYISCEFDGGLRTMVRCRRAG